MEQVIKIVVIKLFNLKFYDKMYRKMGFFVLNCSAFFGLFRFDPHLFYECGTPK